MIPLLFKTLFAGLTLWNTKEARKYRDEIIKLKRDWYEEFNKPDNEIDHSVLDNVEFELRIIGEAFATEVGKQDASNK